MQKDGAGINMWINSRILGRMIATDGEVETDVNIRLAKAAAVFRSL